MAVTSMWAISSDMRKAVSQIVAYALNERKTVAHNTSTISPNGHNTIANDTPFDSLSGHNAIANNTPFDSLSGHNAHAPNASAYTTHELQSLRDLMDYATRRTKTDEQRFVTGVNCDPDCAREQMIITKERFGKPDGRCAYHGYQSFRPGEVIPETAHEIGVALAREVWGERYQVVVATHLDRNHIHNHFVVNSVSFIDGRKFRDNFNDYYGRLRAVSDRLCKERGLSVIENPQSGGKHYGEWRADKEGRPTWRGSIREDVDDAIARAFTMTQFISILRTNGYEVKAGNVKHMAVRPPGKERFVRLRSLGEGYTEDAIIERILQRKDMSRLVRGGGDGERGTSRAKGAPHIDPMSHVQSASRAYTTPRGQTALHPHSASRAHSTQHTDKATADVPFPTSSCKRTRYKGRIPTFPRKKLTGLRALYFHYLYLLGAIPNRRSSTRRTAFLLRADLRKLDGYIGQMKLLNRERIDTLTQLDSFSQALATRISALTAERAALHAQKRGETDEEIRQRLSGQTTDISQTLKTLRRELRWCGQIRENSTSIPERIALAAKGDAGMSKRDASMSKRDERQRNAANGVRAANSTTQERT